MIHSPLIHNFFFFFLNHYNIIFLQEAILSGALDLLHRSLCEHLSLADCTYDLSKTKLVSVQIVTAGHHFMTTALYTILQFPCRPFPFDLVVIISLSHADVFPCTAPMQMGMFRLVY
jgi:hypothetical protein